EHRPGCPCLRQAGDRVSDRWLAGHPREAAEKLRQAHSEMHCSAEALVENMRSAFPIAVACDPCGAYRGVVRPYGTVVIRHRIETRLFRRKGAQSPSRIERRREKLVGDMLGSRR